jgi:hypothetical protein
LDWTGSPNPLHHRRTGGSQLTVTLESPTGDVPLVNDNRTLGSEHALYDIKRGSLRSPPAPAAAAVLAGACQHPAHGAAGDVTHPGYGERSSLLAADARPARCRLR